jgi:hypothetical protein
MVVMSNTAGPKTAYELAMERLQKQDKEAGVERHVVTPEQKTAIGEIRNIYEAKLAQLEIAHQGETLPVFDPDARAALDSRYHAERERLVAERDRKIEQARQS